MILYGYYEAFDSILQLLLMSKKKKRRTPVTPLYSDQMEDLPKLTPEKVFFTADTHFFSEVVLSFRKRFSDLDAMNETLIKNWNDTVPEDGVVFHLGDFAPGATKGKIIELLNLLNGTILLIKGNHDDTGVFRSFDVMTKTRLRLIGYNWNLFLGRRRILLDHYPYLCYAGEYKGVWQLFGHVHSGPEPQGYDIPRLQYLLPFQYDVGVDNNEDRPISFLRLKEIMDERYYHFTENKESE